MSNWEVDWKVTIDGEDISPGLSEYLESITATDKAESTSDTCSITLRDEGKIRLPQPGSELVVHLEGKKVFEGITDIPNFSLNRSGGGHLKISAKGFDERSKVKQPLKFHQDNSTLEDFMKKAARKAGFEIEIHPDLAKIKRDYWRANGISFAGLGNALARELFGAFKIRGKKAVFLPLGVENDLSLIQAKRPGNIISVNMKPRTLRRVFSSGSARYLNRERGGVQEIKEDFDEEDLPENPDNALRHIIADEETAKRTLKARRQQSKREKGSGTIVLNLTPEAQAEALCQVSGVRAGIDGTYRIDSRTHRASRGRGATTSLSLKEPDERAGKDKRKSKVIPKPKPVESYGDGLNRNGTTGTQK